MAEPHRESERKGVASFKAGAEAVDSAEEIEQLVVTFNAAMGEIVKVEKVDKTGKRQELTEEECAKLAGQDEVEEIEAALEEAFEAGVAVVLGDEDEKDAEDDDDEERALRQLLIGAAPRTSPCPAPAPASTAPAPAAPATAPQTWASPVRRESLASKKRVRDPRQPFGLRLSLSPNRRGGSNGQFEGNH